MDKQRSPKNPASRAMAAVAFWVALAGGASSSARADSLVVDLLDNLIGHATGRYVPKGETVALESATVVREAPQPSAEYLYPPDRSYYDTEPQIVIVEPSPPLAPAWTPHDVILGTALVGSAFYWAHAPRHYGGYHYSRGGYYGGYRSFHGSGNRGYRSYYGSGNRGYRSYYGSGNRGYRSYHGSGYRSHRRR